MEQKVPRESEPMQGAVSSDAFSYLLIVCAWCQRDTSAGNACRPRRRYDVATVSAPTVMYKCRERSSTKKLF